MSVRQLNSSAVNISWSRLESEDVSYRVYYFSPDGHADFSGNSSWGVVGQLQGQTQFQVVAFIMIHGHDSEGPRSDIFCTNGKFTTQN